MTLCDYNGVKIALGQQCFYRQSARWGKWPLATVTYVEATSITICLANSEVKQVKPNQIIVLEPKEKNA